MIEWITQNIEAIVATIVGPILGWMVGSKKRKLDGIDAMAATYDKFAIDMAAKYDQLSDEVNNLREKLRKLEQENENLKNQIKDHENKCHPNKIVKKTPKNIVVHDTK